MTYDKDSFLGDERDWAHKQSLKTSEREIQTPSLTPPKESATMAAHRDDPESSSNNHPEFKK